MHEYTRTQTLLANTPYALMVLTGAAVIAMAFGRSPAAWVGAVGYAAYGLAGTVWIMFFICRYCGYYGTRGCPCGYGMVAARLAKKGGLKCFAAQFKRHIPAIVPLWLIPPVCGGWALWDAFSPSLAWLLSAFALNSFLILPLVSRRHACSECPQKDQCPWMAKGSVPSV